MYLVTHIVTFFICTRQPGHFQRHSIMRLGTVRLGIRPSQTFQFSLIAFCVVLLTACGNYSFSLNEKQLYRPPSLFTQYDIADRALSVCVTQTIKDAKITKAEDLKRLNCSSAGIESLAGLETFNKLEALNLAQNQLEDLGPLAQLTRLKTLILRDNAIASAEPLLPLVRLERLDVRANERLDCGIGRQLAKQEALTVELPTHCLAN